MDKKQFAVQYLKDRRRTILAFCGFVGCSFLLYFLFEVRWEPILYTTFLLVLFALPFVLGDLRRTYRTYHWLCELQKADFSTVHNLPAAGTLLEQSYQTLLRQALQAWQKERTEQRILDAERDEYYTLWTHQIKTPLYAMDLMLQTNDTTPTKWKAALIQVSQYVDMALKYLQLESQYADLCLEKVSLLPVAQEAIKMHSVILIAKRLKIELTNLEHTVLTDRKWLLFILGQLISNAAKYTEQGTITIDCPGASQLCIRDTGIGIASEDLPRLFEKGYTGFNGRIHQKSTGCGLYLCKKVSRLLGCTLSVSSQLNKGTEVTLHFPEHDFSAAEA